MEDFRNIWKEKARAGEITVRDMFDRCIMTAVRAKSNDDKRKIAWNLLKRSFTPVTNETKLANGHCRWHSIFEQSFRGKWHTKYSPPSSDWLRSHMTNGELELYKALCNTIFTDVSVGRVPETEYSFFFVRQDIFDEYQLVQNSHVALKLGIEMAKAEPLAPATHWDELHFTCIGLPDLDSLMQECESLLERGIRVVPFYEPDLRNELTAIATFPIKASEKGFLSHHKLLKFKRDE